MGCLWNISTYRGQRDVNLTAYKQELRNQAGTENPLWAEKFTRMGVKMGVSLRLQRRFP